MFGRNYGEKTYRETEEYKELVKAKNQLTFANSELQNVKAKFQNIIDGSANRKQEELLGQILQVFVADLGLRVAENQALLTKETPAVVVSGAAPKTEVNAEKLRSPTPTIEKEIARPQKTFDLKKLKSYEWILTNSASADDVHKNLKYVEIRNLNDFLALAKDAPIQSFQSIFGSYRGYILGVDGKNYGTMLIEISSNATALEKPEAKGTIKIFKENRDTMSSNFTTHAIGKIVDGSGCVILNPGQDNKFYQVYKVRDSQLAGYFYERLTNGTTKTIGSFVLNRTDQF